MGDAALYSHFLLDSFPVPLALKPFHFV